MTVDKKTRRFVSELLIVEVIDKVNVGALYDLEVNLMNCMARAFPDAPSAERGRNAAKILRRTWSRIGEEVIGCMADSESHVPAGVDVEAS
jgi:hypothetical protein